MATLISGAIPVTGTICSISFSQTGNIGSAGATGNDGSNSLRWIYEGLSSSIPIPSVTKFTSDTSSLTTITSLLISTTNASSVLVSAWLAAANAITVAGRVLYLEIFEVGNPAVFAIFGGSVGIASGGVGYYGAGLAGSFITGSGSFTVGKTYSMSWVANGSNGSGGSTGPTGPTGPTGTVISNASINLFNYYNFI